MKRKWVVIASLIFITPAKGDDFRRLAARCAPQVAFSTLKSLVQVESSFNQYAVNVNHGDKVDSHSNSLSEALSLLAKLELEGANFDVGLTQINSNNFARLSLSAEQLLDPCTNLKAGAKILTDCYSRYVSNSSNKREALLKALSCYNSGDEKKGFDNGYVSKVSSLYPKAALAAKDVVPGIDTTETLENRHADDGEVDIFGPQGDGAPDAFSALSR